MNTLQPRQYKPDHWLDHTFNKAFEIYQPREAVWAWLTDPKSFTRQVFPWRVEFTEQRPTQDGGASAKAHTSGGFEPGVLNIHHGPLIHFAGVNTQINRDSDDVWVRDLHYFYGSFAINFRFIRPTRLLFELTEHAEGTSKLSLHVDSYVRGPMTAKTWTWMQSFFWSTFPSAVRSGAAKKAKLNGTREGGLVHAG